jgi:hypothetical protein
MKTHELADALAVLVKILKEGPNIPLSESKITVEDKSSSRKYDEIAVNLTTLSALSQIDKKEWINFAKESGIPLGIRPRDASKDIIGKIMRYLKEHPEEKSKFKKGNKALLGTGSPELLKALSILLKDNDHEDSPS